MAAKTLGETPHCREPETGFALLFREGGRPTASNVEQTLAVQSSFAPARVSHRPDNQEGWLELLTSGLAFDLRGLAPTAPDRRDNADFRFGFDTSQPGGGLEAITLRPGPHLAEGAIMMPVVRTMAGLAARLCAGLKVQAVCWEPARSWMSPDYFARVIESWLSGGVFPALGLTSLERDAQGGVRSIGLAYFIGKEVRVPALPGEAARDTVKLAVRLIDFLIEAGPATDSVDLAGPQGEPLSIAPSAESGELVVDRSRT